LLGYLVKSNQAYLDKEWRSFRTVQPFIAAKISPYVLKPAAEHLLKPDLDKGFRECADEPGKDYCPVMIVIPAGSFVMGSPPTEKGHSSGESPQHIVTIAEPFAVAKFELTFDEWDTCVAYGDCTPGVTDFWGRGQQPVIYVGWDDAHRYAAWLSKVTNKHYRLLSEAEYEYAARAGAQTAYPWGDDIGKNNANCGGCGSRWDSRQTAPVGSFAANKFGLHDMVGNVFEWVEDCNYGNYNGAPADGSAWSQGNGCKIRVVRGGNWALPPDTVRSASRYGISAAERTYGLGFRVGRTLNAP
jgi:formylglycine-generating enzyme required for sulfatase activity